MAGPVLVFGISASVVYGLILPFWDRAEARRLTAAGDGGRGGGAPLLVRVHKISA